MTTGEHPAVRDINTNGHRPHCHSSSSTGPTAVPDHLFPFILQPPKPQLLLNSASADLPAPVGQNHFILLKCSQNQTPPHCPTSPCLEVEVEVEVGLVSLPLRIDALLRGYWVFGDGLCRINLFLMFSNRTASIALLTVVAVYRYFKVVHPHHRFNCMTKRQAAYVSVFVWLVVISPRVPMLAYNHIKGSGDKTQCFFFTSYKEASRAILILVAMHRILTVVEFIVPLALLLFCSVRISSFLKQRQMGKPDKVRKAMRVCAAIVVVFMVCFLPTTVTTIGVWIIRSYRPWDCAAFYTFTQLNIVSLGLNFLNSALDPVVYVFSSSMFRKALTEAMPCSLRCGRDAGENAASSSGSQSTTEQELRSMRADKDGEAR